MIRFDIKKFGFTIRDIGPEVYKHRADESVDTVTLKNYDDIKEGDELAIPWLSGGFAIMEAQRNKKGEFFAKGQSYIALLCFGEDDRHCWTCGGIVNVVAMEKLSVTKD